MTLKLVGYKHPDFRQLWTEESRLSAVFKCFDPLFISHVRSLCLECPYGPLQTIKSLASRLLGACRKRGQ
jgi:hypothetical protein